jgi:hypothetical protein
LEEALPFGPNTIGCYSNFIFGKMAQRIIIQDETPAGKVSHSFELVVAEEVLTLSELIRQRVRFEVDQYNNRKPDYFNGLVQPAEAEKVLNGYQLKARRQIDAEKQVYMALHAFQQNAFFVLLDNQQVTELEEVVLLKPSSTLSFIKLTPLVGG